MIDNTRGILAMSASVVVFIFNDALIKTAPLDKLERKISSSFVFAGLVDLHNAGMM